MGPLGIILIVILVVYLLWPSILRWLRRMMMRRAEDYMRRMTGMPPRPDSREGRRRSRDAGQERRRTAERGPRNNGDALRAMREVAQDVEFTETIDYSEETEITGEGRVRQKRTCREEQVTDAEFTIIDDSSKRKK